mmetsp:Transcript_29631/g.62835  ORF Transcript_29631/g.62835 Transcript_29631/m.62835 type:complete len:196 (-) Transcript_29631:145-732(-)
MSLSHCLRLCSQNSALTRGMLCRSISTTAAKSMLGFSEEEKFTIRELRHAYFEAAKRHHPDVVQQHQQTDNANSDGALDFRNITEAYEHLLSGDHNIQYSKEEMQNIVSISEEEEYRLACKEILGLPAEIVEESKKNPMFRRWLTGNTDAAHHWRVFFAGHGGLAQKLRPPAGYLGRGEEDGIVKKSETRRKRSR